ncbi:MAG: hypothetical protein ACXQT0_02000, partial [Candidatus Methanofastidiosia archaeon]
MANRCGICGKGINPSEIASCMHCNTPYHFDCIKEHLFTKKNCPHCGRASSLMHYRRGIKGKPAPAPQPSKKPAANTPSQTPSKKSTFVYGGKIKKKAPQPHAPSPPKEKSPKRKGSSGLFLSFIIVLLLLASTYYVTTTYVGYAPVLSADELNKTVIPGQAVEFQISFENGGNIISHYNVYIDDKNSSLPDELKAVLMDDNSAYGESLPAVVEPGSSFPFYLRVTSASGVLSEIQGTVMVVVESRDKKYSDSMLFTITSKTIYNYEVIPGNTQKYVPAGGMTTFSATLVNKGNTVDTYSILLENTTSGWQSGLIDNSKVTIEPNESALVILTLKSPDAASGNEKGETILKIISQNNSSDIKTFKYSLIVNPTYGFDLLVSEHSKVVLPGSTTSYTFKIRNQGNSSDTYDLRAVPNMPYGWSVELSKTSVTIRQGEEMTIGVSITVPESALPNQSGVVNVNIVSAGNQETKNQSFEVTTAEGQDKIVLVELFTSVNCTFCPYAENAVEQLLFDYPGNYIVLEYHLNDRFNTTFSTSRAGFYSIPGTPTSIFDGTRKEAGGSPLTYNKYVTKTQDLIQEELQLRIDLSLSESSVPGYTNVNALIKSTGLPAGNDLDIFFVTYSNGVSSGSKTFDHVVVDGAKRTLSSFDNIDNITLAFEIPEDGGIVVYVQDKTTK